MKSLSFVSMMLVFIMGLTAAPTVAAPTTCNLCSTLLPKCLEYCEAQLVKYPGNMDVMNGKALCEKVRVQKLCDNPNTCGQGMTDIGTGMYLCNRPEALQLLGVK